MTHKLIGTVIVAEGVAVCQRPDGRIHMIGGKPSTFPVFGGLREYDAGKRIYDVGGVLQMENDAQRDERLNR